MRPAGVRGAEGAHAARPGAGRPRRSALWCGRSCWAPRMRRCRRRRPRSRPRLRRSRRSPCRRRRRRRSIAAPRGRGRRPPPRLRRRRHSPGQAAGRTGLGGPRRPPRRLRVVPRRPRNRRGSGPSLRRRSAPPRSLQWRPARGAARVGPGADFVSACTGTGRLQAKWTPVCAQAALAFRLLQARRSGRGRAA